MDNFKDIRWKQRFQNYENAFRLLEKYINIENPNILERAGIIQLFEMAYELSWKTIKDYLEAEGYEIKSPREALKTAFQSGLISSGHIWIEGLDDRNLTVHTYDEKTALEIVNNIKNKYFNLLTGLHADLRGKI